MITPDQKKMIAEYCGWSNNGIDDCYYREFEACKYEEIYFDLNDAGEVVKVMVERGDWIKFVYFIASHREYSYDLSSLYNLKVDLNTKIHIWLFNSDNFFTAMASWLEGRRK